MPVRGRIKSRSENHILANAALDSLGPHVVGKPAAYDHRTAHSDRHRMTESVDVVTQCLGFGHAEDSQCNRIVKHQRPVKQLMRGPLRCHHQRARLGSRVDLCHVVADDMSLVQIS